MIDTHQKNIATCIHLSTFSRFIIPFGNIIAPVLLWSINKDKSDFINKHGKEAINFQISILLYALVCSLLTIPVFIFKLFSNINFIDFNGFNMNINTPHPMLFIGGTLGFITVLCFLIELIIVIIASLKAKDGLYYKYPLTIKFLK